MILYEMVFDKGWVWGEGGGAILHNGTPECDTWGYHIMSTYIIRKYIICEYVSLSYAHIIIHTTEHLYMTAYEFAFDLYIGNVWVKRRIDCLISFQQMFANFSWTLKSSFSFEPPNLFQF